MKPSETAAGSKFIARFYGDDQYLARLLLDSLKIVDEGNFLSGLRMALEWKLDRLDGQPVALVPIGEAPASPGGITKYSDIDSRYIVATVCRELRRSRSEVIDGWDPELMRVEKVRHLVFVDDLIGSGESLQRAVAQWLAHKSIRSWISYQLCDIHAVSYGVTTRGSATAEKLSIPLVAYDASCDLESASLRNPAIDCRVFRKLFNRYGTKPQRGFGDAEALILIQHTVPNSLPSIFCQRRGTDGGDWPRIADRWTYAFQGDFATASPYQPADRILDLLKIRVPRVAAAWLSRQSHVTLQILLVAVLSVRDRRTPIEIANITGLPSVRVGQLFGFASELGLMNNELLNRELRSAEVSGPWQTIHVAPKPNHYFPRFTRFVG